MQIFLYLSYLGHSWSHLAYLGRYYYVKVRQARLLYCPGINCQVSGYSADLTSKTSVKPLHRIIATSLETCRRLYRKMRLHWKSHSGLQSTSLLGYFTGKSHFTGNMKVLSPFTGKCYFI